MASNTDIDVPAVMRHAQDEVILALWAETDEAEAAHRARAAALMREAVKVISNDPRRIYDWSPVVPSD